MSTPSKAKSEQILTELEETTDRTALLFTMEQLDEYQVNPPSEQATADLIALLKTHLPEEPASFTEPVPEALHRIPAVFQLVRPQMMLLNKWFVAVSVLLLLAGLALTNAVNGDTLKFLTNSAPLLGIFTLFFEFRAKLSGMAELEAVCPYSAAQLAAARLLVVLCYDILLCLAVTPLVSLWQGRLLWRVMVGWFAPLLMTLGIALAVSLHFKIMNGCLIAAFFWVLQLTMSESRVARLASLINQASLPADLIRMGVGGLLLLYTYWRWNSVAGSGDDSPEA
jgi:hypothetical protein